MSVSRVGSAAQTKAMKKVSGKLRLDLAQFRELEAFAQFATDLDEGTKKQIERGRRAVEVSKQPQYQPMAIENQVAILFAVTNGLIDDVPVEKIQAWEIGFHTFMKAEKSGLLETIKMEKDLSDTTTEGLKLAISEFKEIFGK
ncbi:TPA: hypothetical protein DIC21_01270 [Candidatus Uhrbacteria bacterium]|nr:hypothetical protein [Candidatus Uhrbacteria bacterium]